MGGDIYIELRPWGKIRAWGKNKHGVKLEEYDTLRDRRIRCIDKTKMIQTFRVILKHLIHKTRKHKTTHKHLYTASAQAATLFARWRLPGIHEETGVSASLALCSVRLPSNKKFSFVMNMCALREVWYLSAIQGDQKSLRILCISATTGQNWREFSSSIIPGKTDYSAKFQHFRVARWGSLSKSAQWLPSNKKSADFCSPCSSAWHWLYRRSKLFMNIISA